MKLSRFLATLAFPALGASTLCSSASAQFSAEQPPAWRGAADTHFAGWDQFTQAYGQPNDPDVMGSTAQEAQLTQNTPGAILTSTGNLYHPGAASSFTLTDQVAGDLAEVTLQTRAAGSPLDNQSPVLSYTVAGTTHALLPSEHRVLATGAAFEDWYRWELCAHVDIISSYQISFVATAAHCSLTNVHLDARFDGACDSLVGTNYCMAANNSTGLPAQIDASGSDVAAENNLILRAHQLPTDEFGYFLAGTAQDFLAMPGGSVGNLCLGGALARFNQQASQIGNSGMAGEFSVAVDLTQIPTNPSQAITAGETWNFQCWFRDGIDSNFTDGVSILFQ